MDYVVAVQAPAYALSDTSFATESAFAEHLKELRQKVGPRFDKLVLLAPKLSQAQYEASKAHLGVLELARDQIQLVQLHEANCSPKEFWTKHFAQLHKNAEAAIQNAGVVHSGISDDTYRPALFIINLLAWRKKIPVVFVVDIDFRRHTERNYKLGTWDFKAYLVNRVVHDPLRYLQVWLAPRMFQLVLLKSASLVADFGRGKSHVKNFYDTVHGPEDVLTDDALQARLSWLRDPSRPLELVYFGRFVPYKGLDRAVEALALARKRGADVRLTLIGGGECEQALREQAARLGIADAVTFKGQVRYGKELFAQLNRAHLSLNTPLREDTPRSAFDAMARAIPIVAFDISYFRDLAAESGAVALASWPEPSSLADQFVALSQDRARIAHMAQKGVEFARRNTQSEWLERRTRWVLEVAERSLASKGLLKPPSTARERPVT